MSTNSEEESKEYNKRKWKYILKTVLLTRIIPILILLITIDEAFYKTYDHNKKIFPIIVLIKVVLGLLAGLIAGINEWKFTEKLYDRQFKSIYEIKRVYAKVFGILGWGVVIGVSYFRYPIKSIYSVVIDLVIWIAFGYLLGMFTWGKNKEKYEKFID